MVFSLLFLLKISCSVIHIYHMGGVSGLQQLLELAQATFCDLCLLLYLSTQIVKCWKLKGPVECILLQCSSVAIRFWLPFSICQLYRAVLFLQLCCSACNARDLIRLKCTIRKKYIRHLLFGALQTLGHYCPISQLSIAFKK